MAARQRQHDRVFGRGRLQLKIELAAEPLAQRQTPGAVDAAAQRRMNDQLRTARLVEEAFEHDGVARRQLGQRRLGGGKIVNNLRRGDRIDLHRLRQPSVCRFAPAFVEPRRDRCTQSRQRLRCFLRARRRLAEPERNARGRSLRILDPDRAALDAQDAIRRIAQLEHIARQAFHRKIFVHRADYLRLRLQHHRVIGGIGYCAARCDRSERGAAPSAQDPVDRVMVQMRAAPAALRVKPIGQHPHQLTEFFAGDVAERIGALINRQQLVFLPLLQRNFGDDLLCQNIERLVRHLDAVELPEPHCIEQRCTVAQLVARQRKQPSLRSSAYRVAGATDALQ